LNAASDSSLAEETATPDIVSHNRMVLGVSLGYQPADRAMYSVPQAECVWQWFQDKQTG
jgi:alkanesulfonate monooxygenase SsuD/methylene tetrahydromethanopterin reductase-like flavin-dependent oxidoreductase (luciferase family)